MIAVGDPPITADRQRGKEFQEHQASGTKPSEYLALNKLSAYRYFVWDKGNCICEQYE